MAFIELENSTTADATDINNNFYHVAQGSVLPMGGVDLDYTDSVYDLGSSSATWNYLKCLNINTNNVEGYAGYLISEVTLTATASSIEFTGLNEENKFVKIIAYIPKCGGNVNLILNNISSSSYSGLHIRVQGASLSATETTTTYCNLGSATGGASFLQCTILDSSHYGKTININALNHASITTINSIHNNSYLLLNSTTLTSIKIISSNGILNPLTNIQVWY